MTPESIRKARQNLVELGLVVPTDEYRVNPKTGEPQRVYRALMPDEFAEAIGLTVDEAAKLTMEERIDAMQKLADATGSTPEEVAKALSNRTDDRS